MKLRICKQLWPSLHNRYRRIGRANYLVLPTPTLHGFHADPVALGNLFVRQLVNKRQLLHRCYVGFDELLATAVATAACNDGLRQGATQDVVAVACSRKLS